MSNEIKAEETKIVETVTSPKPEAAKLNGDWKLHMPSRSWFHRFVVSAKDNLRALKDGTVATCKSLKNAVKAKANKWRNNYGFHASWAWFTSDSANYRRAMIFDLLERYWKLRAEHELQIKSNYEKAWKGDGLTWDQAVEFEQRIRAQVRADIEHAAETADNVMKILKV